VPNVEHATSAELRGMLLRVLEEPEFARNAARLQAELRSASPPSEMVLRLEQLVAEHRVPNR
jgi:UDP:flavonoid glycosyltransferase YjiC (YdhE family)